MKRIKVWQSEGLEADPLFSEKLAEELFILDDDALWEEYEQKKKETFELSSKIIDQLRAPTSEEIEEYRQRIVAEMAREWELQDRVEKQRSESHAPSECPAKAEGNVMGCGNCRELTGDSY